MDPVANLPLAWRFLGKNSSPCS